MIIKKDPRVDTYIQTLPEWQQDICQKVRTIIHEADPHVEETIKRSIYPYFTLQGNICAFQGTKDHVNIFIYDPIAPDPEHIINQGLGNKTARSIQIYETDNINRQAFLKLFKAIIEHNKKGGWRKVIDNSR